MDIGIRFSNEIDKIVELAEPVQSLHYELFPEYFKPFSFDQIKNHIEQQLKDVNWKCYIASYGRKDVGYALFYIREYEENAYRKSYKGIHIDQISIMEKYRKKGIGKMLMNKIMEFAKENGSTQIELTHWEDNKEAKTFYAHLGFKTKVRFVVKEIQGKKLT